MPEWEAGTQDKVVAGTLRHGLFNPLLDLGIRFVEGGQTDGTRSAEKS